MPNSFEDRLSEIVKGDDSAYTKGLKKVKQTLDIFHQQLQTLIRPKKFSLTSSVQGITSGSGTEFHYALTFEILATGASYDLLSFAFYPVPGQGTFPLRVITEPDQQEGQVDCQSMEEFELFLVERAKNIRRALQMLSIIASQ